MSEKLNAAKIEFEVAENQFNWATGDAIDAAIERYNRALENYNRELQAHGFNEITV